MSLDATIWAWTRTVGRASAKLVLLAIADRAGADHSAFPSIARLEEDTELDRKTIMASIAHLESLGLISAERFTGRATRYHLNGVIDRQRTSTRNGTSPKNGTSTRNGTEPVPKTGLDQYQKRDTNLSGTYQEPEKDNAREKSAPLDLSELPPLQVAVWQDFLKHRKAIKAPLTTQTAINRLGAELHRIAAAGIDPDEALSEAIESGWRTVKLGWLLNRKQKDSPHHETDTGLAFPNSAIERVKAANRRREAARSGTQPRLIEGERLG